MNEKLNRVLEKWKQKIKNDFPAKSFVSDGIINEKYWQNCQPKILIIMKEVNSEKDDFTSLSQLVNDRIGHKSQLWKYIAWHNIGRVTNGLLEVHHNMQIIPIKDAEKDRQEVLKNIAVMNIKKTPGGDSSKDKEILKHAENYSELIKEEIKVINPDIIILGGTYKYLKEILQLEKQSYRIHKDPSNRVYINAYHPSARIGKGKYYSEVVQSYYNYLINQT